MEESTMIYSALNQSTIGIGEIEERIKRLKIGSLKKSSGKKKKKQTEILKYGGALFNNTEIEAIINEIDNDSYYLNYKTKIKKAEQVNKTNFFSKQPQLSIIPGLIGIHKKRNNYDYNTIKLGQEQWMKMRNVLGSKKAKRKSNSKKAKRKSNSKVKDDSNDDELDIYNDEYDIKLKATYYESNLSSDDSYDSDLNPFQKQKEFKLQNRINEIKKKKIKEKDKIIQDMKQLYQIYQLISE